MRMGLPRVITSDNGKEFNNNLLDEKLMKLLGIEHRLTTAYHPQVCHNIDMVCKFNAYNNRLMVLLKELTKQFKMC